MIVFSKSGMLRFLAGTPSLRSWLEEALDAMPRSNHKIPNAALAMKAIEDVK